jgi:hypothetical protein
MMKPFMQHDHGPYMGGDFDFVMTSMIAGASGAPPRDDGPRKHLFDTDDQSLDFIGAGGNTGKHIAEAYYQ